MYFDGFLNLRSRRLERVRYESFWSNHDVLYDAISMLLSISILPQVRKDMTEQYGLPANRLRASRLRDFNEHDESGIHGDHIATPEPGRWREIIPEPLHGVAICATRCYVEALGYS
jgi:hypothetical protein